MSGVLLRDAEVEGRRVDVRLDDGRVLEVGPALRAGPAEDVLDAEGGALLPGLTDHHLHLHAAAAAQDSVRCGPPAVHGRQALAAALAVAPGDEHGWVRGIDYHPSVAGHLDAAGLDLLHARRPVRMQHHSGALWIVNSLAATALGLAGADHPGVERDARGVPTGRLWRCGAWLRMRLPRTGPPRLDPVSARLSRFGVTAVTDATPDLDAEAMLGLSAAVDDGSLAQRVTLLGVPLDRPAPHGTTAGPFKVVLAGPGLPDVGRLAGRIRAAHDAGRGVAAHCVSREALLLFLAALDEGGGHPADRVEHASLVPAGLLADLARRRLRVVTQPGFLAARGDRYLRDVPVAEHADLCRCRSLLDAGVPLAFSSDAPYGPLDPWAVIAAAADRLVPGGAVCGPDERLATSTALDAFLSPAHDPGGPARRVRAGAPADLVLLDGPLDDVLAAPRHAGVRATLIGGRVVHGG